ncbi:isoprenyl transferase [Heliophilum fasciatum]|uniref:Isoprenyl transferase n=1 Tax=Heliophilum fasciatum TaxID=35700 RepID=A0A4R2RKT4_9FIRM|nr:isoprenyl transferase [Heliophilum fasciatum]MCW2277908.1 undecaprenyl diphosphate synthase [Heliophilum fasciatum]TCP64522.1 undecaprenyl pyrophosphate synthetase [Heliophilum fasciatum]
MQWRFWPFHRRRKGAGSDDLSAQLNAQKLPKHVAIIMDGNGRWAKRRGLPRAAGHRAGVESLRQVLETCTDLGIQVLTVYAFSTENWKRPADEVSALMDLLVEYLRKEIKELHEKGVRVRAIGKVDDLPQVAQRELASAIKKTQDNRKITLNLALNYGGRVEIVEAVKKVVANVTAGTIQIDDINEQYLEQHLYTAGLPDPDLLIRPSGELRLSNFLLWQSAYTEICVTSTLWPDFGRQELLQALIDYQGRDRRFGGVKV